MSEFKCSDVKRNQPISKHRLGYVESSAVKTVIDFFSSQIWVKLKTNKLVSKIDFFFSAVSPSCNVRSENLEQQEKQEWSKARV